MCATIAESYVAPDPEKGIAEKPETVFRVIQSFGGGVYSQAGPVTIYTANGQPINVNPKIEMPPKSLKYKPLQVVVCKTP